MLDIKIDASGGHPNSDARYQKSKRVAVIRTALDIKMEECINYILRSITHVVNMTSSSNLVNFEGSPGCVDLSAGYGNVSHQRERMLKLYPASESV
jgi:hypothetical protein